MAAVRAYQRKALLHLSSGLMITRIPGMSTPSPAKVPTKQILPDKPPTVKQLWGVWGQENTLPRCPGSFDPVHVRLWSVAWGHRLFPHLEQTTISNAARGQGNGFKVVSVLSRIARHFRQRQDFMTSAPTSRADRVRNRP